MEEENQVPHHRDTSLHPLLPTKVTYRNTVGLGQKYLYFDLGCVDKGTDIGSSCEKKDDYDVIGTLPGFEKLVEAESSKQSKGKLVMIIGKTKCARDKN